MEYMARHREARTEPARLVPGTIRAVMVALDYAPDDPAWLDRAWSTLADHERAYVSRYALGRDYHKVVRARLASLATRLENEIGAFGWRAFCDSAPVMEVELVCTFTGSTFAGKLGTASTYGYWSNSNSTSYIQFNGASAGIPNTVYVTANTGGVQLNSGATAWTSASDARLKNVTGKYDNALADIAQIEPVKFTWKSDTKNKPQVGVLAHTVKAVVPEAVDSQTLVRSEDTTEYLSVRYTELIPLMIASIQELKAEIDSLKQQLASK
jgi:hypothetical protein